jgi:hypothetical protein
MRRDLFTFTPEFKLLIAGNHEPRLHAVDEAHAAPAALASPELAALLDSTTARTWARRRFEKGGSKTNAAAGFN